MAEQKLSTKIIKKVTNNVQNIKIGALSLEDPKKSWRNLGQNIVHQAVRPEGSKKAIDVECNPIHQYKQMIEYFFATLWAVNYLCTTRGVLARSRLSQLWKSGGL